LPLGNRSGAVPMGRVGLLVAVVLVCAAAAVLFLLFFKTPSDRPAGRGADAQSPVTSAPRAADEALKQETFDVVQQLIEDFPGSAYPLGLMGTVQNNYGNTAEAEAWWWKCLERDPRRADVYAVLAMSALEKGEYEKVADLLHKAEAINPNLPGVHRRYAEALMNMGKLDEALAMIQKEVRIAPDAGSSYILLGKIRLQREEYEEAVAAYSRAIELSKLDSRAYYGLATAYERLGKDDEAAKYMDAFKTLRAQENEVLTSRRRAVDKPRHPAKILSETLIDAGRVYSDHRQFGKAERCWKRAAALAPSSTACRLELLSLYGRTRRGKEALAVVEELRKIDPDNATYHLNAGLLLAQLKRYDEAEEAMRKAIELTPGSARAYQSLVELLLRRRSKPPETEALAKKLVALEPTAYHYALLGEACSRNLDRAGALEAMKRATELAPDDENIRRAYQRLLKKK
jgi:tetratricopeptide (TPR) repeat protein